MIISRTPPPGGPEDSELARAGLPHTTPTWELELLISGALVVTLTQLPGVVEQYFARIEPHLTSRLAQPVVMVALYAKAIAYALLGTFMVHFVVRAQWVALIGLHSVFPAGIRWDELKFGRISREEYQRHHIDLPQRIARLDNLASIVFAFGFLIVLAFIYTIVLALVVSVLSTLVGAGGGGGRFSTQVSFFAIMAAYVAVPIIASAMDKRYGEKLADDSPRTRVLRRAIGVSYTLSGMRFFGSFLLTMMSNIGRRRAAIILNVALLGLIALVGVDRLAAFGALSFNTYDFFARSETSAVDYRHYESQRTRGVAYGRLPSIQSDVIREPYIKLFVPYAPRRHNGAIRRICPEVEPLQERTIQFGLERPAADSVTRPVLDCLERIHAVAIDGAPIAAPGFHFYEHPLTGQKGLLGYLPTEGLPRGRHVLTVMPVPPETLPADSAALANAVWKRPYFIPFWL